MFVCKSVQNTARRAEYDAIDVFADVEEGDEGQSENEESSPLLTSNLSFKHLPWIFLSFFRSKVATLYRKFEVETARPCSQNLLHAIK
jgi:hypothetical protein